MMTPRSSVARIACSLAVLLVYYAAFQVWPPGSQASVSSSGNGGGELTIEQSRELLDHSRSLMRRDRYQEALEITGKLHQAYPRNDIYLFQLATIYRHLNRPADEAQVLEKYIDVTPTPFDACPRIGHAYQKMGDTKRALASLERCLSFDPKDSDNILFLGLGYERAGMRDKAAETYARGVEQTPDYPDLVIALARVRLRQGDLEQARHLFTRIRERWPDNSDGLLVSGMIHRSLGELEEATRLLEKGAEKARSDPDFQIVLGGIAEQQDRVRDAISHYDEVLRLDPGNGEIARRRQRLLGDL